MVNCQILTDANQNSKVKIQKSKTKSQNCGFGGLALFLPKEGEKINLVKLKKLVFCG